jgi:hypothetical protein
LAGKPRWAAGARRALEEAGMRVESKVVRYARLTGGEAWEYRLTGYSPDGLVKVTLSQLEGEPGVRVSVTAQGPASTSTLARALEAVGASIDHEEGERTLGVVRRVGEGEVAGVLRRILRG